MSGAWDAMVATATDQLRSDHGLVQAHAESASVNSHRWGSSWRQGHRTGWWAGVEWVLAQQAMWESLTEAEAIAELRKGVGSVYYPLFADDPHIFAECPIDGRVAVGAEGYCDQCTYEWI